MKRLHLLARTRCAAAIATIALHVSVADAQELPQPMTLAQAISFARQHSPLLAARHAAVSAEEAGVKAAWSGHLPRLAVGAAYRLSEPGTRTALGLPLTPFADIPEQPRSGQHVNGVISATVPIYLGGRVTEATHVADAQRDLAAARAVDTEREVVFQVTRSFTNLVELDRDVEAAYQSLDALTESRRTVEEMLAAQKVARVDLLKVDTRHASVRATVIAFVTARQIEVGRLNSLLGRPVDLQVAVPTEMPRKELPAEPGKLDDVLAQNTRVRVASADAQIAGRQAALARAGLLPSIVAVGNLWTQGLDLAGTYRSGVAGGLVLSVPIDAALFHRAKESASRELEGRAELEQVRLDAQERIRTAYLQAQDAAERIRATEAAVGYADEALRIEREKQRLGRSTIENLLDAQAALLSSQSNYYRALGDETIAVAAVEREAGPGPQEAAR